MSTIWIKCPATGRRVATGIETDTESFAQFPRQLENVLCLWHSHQWLKDDAWLEADGADYSSLRKTG